MIFPILRILVHTDFSKIDSDLYLFFTDFSLACCFNYYIYFSHSIYEFSFLLYSVFNAFIYFSYFLYF